ncbi:MAG: AAA family ATPase, partial [bacterium]
MGTYTKPVRDLLVDAKRAVVASGVKPVPHAALIGWAHVAAAASVSGVLDSALKEYLKVAQSRPAWPGTTIQLAASMKEIPQIDVPLKPDGALSGLLSSVPCGGGGDSELKLADFAKILWAGAPDDWRRDFCGLNGIEYRQAPGPAGVPMPIVGAGAMLSGLKTADGICDALRKDVYGQDHAIREIAEALFKSQVTSVGAVDAVPKMVFLFMGPSGVGKTYTAERLGTYLKDSQGTTRPVRVLDMSGFSTSEAGLLALTGFPPSYKSSRPGQLTGFVNEHPNAVVIFDEVEKASSEVIRVLLQVLGRGLLEDNNLRKSIPFKDTVLVFTTNAGRQLYENLNRTGLTFDAARVHADTILDALEQERNANGQAVFPRELCSRLAMGYPVLFRPLQPSDYDRIVCREIERQTRCYEERFALSVVCADPIVRTLLVLRSGPDLDARKVGECVSRFLSEFLYDGFQDRPDFFTEEKLGKAKCIEIRLAKSGQGAEIVQQLDKSSRKVLLIDDRPEFLELFKAKCPKFSWFGAGTTLEACEILRRESISFVLQDLDLRGSVEGPMDVSTGIDCLKVLHERFPRLPIYILSRALSRTNFDEGLYHRCVEAGGARGYIERVLTSMDQDSEAGEFAAQLETVRTNLAREELIRQMTRSRKRVVFDVDFQLHAASASVHCNLHNIRFEVVPSSGAYGLFTLSRPGIRFKDVAGCEQAMKELKLVVDWLKDPAAFQKLGAHIKRGVLLVGPPGTGKTLLARAMAGEAEVPFVAAKASEFKTVWQASGAKAVRELFAEARKHAPAIVFVDEIDAIGESRAARSSNSNEDRQTLLQLLTEMDGFAKEVDAPPVIV